MRFGALPSPPDKRDITFGTLASEAALKPAPVGFGHWPSLLRVGLDWGYLGNDTVGDCVLAGAAHETMLWNAQHGVAVPFSTESVISDYSAVTGYNPADPSSDQGTVVRDALSYRRKTGLADAHGTRHKVGAYVALRTGDFGELLQALRVFDSVAVALEIPESAMQQYYQRRPWAYTGDRNIVGGHYVPVVGRYSVSGVQVVTWGRLQKMTRAFYEHANMESYGIVSPEALGATGTTPEGLDLSALNAALARL